MVLHLVTFTIFVHTCHLPFHTITTVHFIASPHLHISAVTPHYHTHYIQITTITCIILFITTFPPPPYHVQLLLPFHAYHFVSSTTPGLLPPPFPTFYLPMPALATTPFPIQLDSASPIPPPHSLPAAGTCAEPSLHLTTTTTACFSLPAYIPSEFCCSLWVVVGILIYLPIHL